MSWVTCIKCDRPIRETQAFVEVTGWTPPRKQGGANTVALRKPTGKFMCVACMHVAKLGHGDQLRLG